MPGYQTGDFVLVENLGEINRALKLSGPGVFTAMKKGMLEGAEPIRADAQSLAEGLTGMSRKRNSDWGLQRSGETIHEVYIAPVERGNKNRIDANPSRRRPKFVEIMFGRSYEPALERGTPALITFTDNWVSKVVKEL